MPRKKITETSPPEDTALALPAEDRPWEEGAPLPTSPEEIALDETEEVKQAAEGAFDGETSPPMPEPDDTSCSEEEKDPFDLMGSSSDFIKSVEPANGMDASEDTASPMQAPQEENTPSNTPSESLDDLLAEVESDQEYAEPEETEDGPAEEILGSDTPETAPLVETAPPKARRTVRRRKATATDESAPSDVPKNSDPAPAARRVTPAILSIDAKAEVETEEYREDTIWHEIRNAYRTRRILTGTLGGVEQTDDGKTLVIVEYKGFRVVIPAKEMMISLGRRPSGNAYADLMRRQNQILSAMMGAEIDFIVRGIDNKTRSIVASRKEAMLKKRQTFYLDTDQNGMYRIYEGRLVQARVTAVAEKVIRIEAFGAECPIMARDLAWDWMGDAHERFSVGDRIIVRILSVQRNSLEDISIRADVKSVSTSTDLDNLSKCRVQGKYAGRVTDVHRGVVFIRLTNGVNAIAHSCLDRRMPGKKDDVSFAVTHIDTEQGVAMGIITKIIKQNL